MSIYRKIAPDPKNDVHATTISPRPKPVEASVRADAEREEAERSKRSKGEPIGSPLPRTFQWCSLCGIRYSLVVPFLG